MTHIPNTTRRMLKLAALAVAGACVAGSATYAQQQDRSGQAQDRTGQTEDRIGQRMQQDQAQIDRAKLPQGIKWSDEPADVGEVRGVLDDIVGAAVIEGGFNDVVERFVDQDRNRFGEWMNEGDNREFTQFNASAKKFQEAYTAKYNKEFDFDAETALAKISAVQGEVEDAAIAAANWPAKPFADTGIGAGAEPRVAGGEMQDRQVDDETREQGNIEDGRQVAIVLIPAPNGGMAQGQRTGTPRAGEVPPPEQAADRARDAAQGAQDRAARGMGQPMRGNRDLHVSLINEFPGTWKVDVPNDRQPQQVYTDLAQCLDKLTADTASWPSEEAQAQQVIAHKILGAIYGADSQMQGRQPGMNRPNDRLNGQADRPPTGRDDEMDGGN